MPNERRLKGLRRGSVAVVGAAESDLGKVADHTSPVDLMAQATRRALDDCGLKMSDIDGVFCAAGQIRLSPLVLCEYLRLKPKFFDGTIIGGSSFMAHIAHAQAAIEAGLCEVALIAYGSTQKTVSRTAAGRPEYNYYETPFKPFLPGSAYAMAAARHMHEFGTTREQLAEVAVAARKWALLNPVAWEKEPLTIEQVLNARMVSYPFTVRDCCLVTDGGGAIILTSAARAKTLKKKPVYVLGTGEAIGHATISNMENFVVTAAAESGPKAFKMAGVKHVRHQDAVALRRLHHHADPVPRRPRLLPEGRRRPLRRRRQHRARRQSSRSTPAAAGCPTTTRACTACWC